MSNISQIKVNNTTYDIEDSNARSRLTTIETNLTTQTTDLSNGITINKNGNICTINISGTTIQQLLNTTITSGYRPKTSVFINAVMLNSSSAVWNCWIFVYADGTLGGSWYTGNGGNYTDFSSMSDKSFQITGCASYVIS